MNMKIISGLNYLIQKVDNSLINGLMEQGTLRRTLIMTENDFLETCLFMHHVSS